MHTQIALAAPASAGSGFSDSRNNWQAKKSKNVIHPVRFRSTYFFHQL